MKFWYPLAPAKVGNDLSTMKNSNWQVDAHFFDKLSSSHWVLMARVKESRNRWLNFRLCVLGSGRRKRSYQLGWSPRKQRLAEGEESFRLHTELPELHQRITDYLSKSMSTKPLKTPTPEYNPFGKGIFKLAKDSH